MQDPRLETEFSRTLASLSLVIVLILVAPVSIIQVRGDYQVIATRGAATIDIVGDFAQGLSLPPPINGTTIFAAVPTLHTVLQGANASILQTALTDAINAKTPTAGVSGLRLTVDSNGTLLHYELGFTLTNLSTPANGQEKMDFSWRSFAIAEDFGANGVSINKALPNYLQTTINLNARVTGTPAGITEVRTWFLNNLLVPAAQVPARTSGILLFDFSSLSQPLGQWSVQRNFATSQVILQSQTGFNLTYVVRITEAELTTYAANDAVNKLTVKIQAPLPAQINDNSLVYDTGQSAWAPQLMLALMGTVVAILTGTFIAERRVQPPRGSRPKGRQK